MDYYQQMLQRVDHFFAQTRGRYPASFACRSGCSGCCKLHLSLFPVEAEAVGKAVAELPPEVQERVRAEADAVDACPLLVDDQCAIYESRPLICRSHGLPVKFEEDGKTEVDVCPLNFEDGKIPEDAMLDIDHINELLVSINMFESRKKGVDPGLRTRMADIIGKALMGLMLVVFTVGPAWADDFKAGYESWKAAREASLRKPDGWLALAGLFWLEPGGNSFGSGDGNTCRFPSGPARIGTFVLRDKMVEMTIAPGVAVTSAGAPISGVAISTEAPEGEQKFSLGTLSWYVIVRDGRVGVRLKDSASPALSGFRGVPAFAPDVRWRIPARFEAKASTREVPTATGQSGTMKVAGLLVFDFNGQEIRLEAYDDGGKDLFVMFKDKTSGRTTYPAGRYLYVPRPDAEGRTVVDFNRAYNPPCAFTPFATCPFPPRTNHLNFAVEAGEKTYH